jgi:mitochondrial enoyl-[acyl-carrier protein] reductase / trans-2-enoyl-CoA reductase
MGPSNRFRMIERLIIRAFGPPTEVVERVVEGMERRALAEGEVRLRIIASPINPADTNWIEGTYGVKPCLPETPGSEACAEVTESRSRLHSVGSRVIFLGYAHGWQGERIAQEDEIFPVPSGLAAEQLAMLKVNPATAWLMLRSVGELPKNGAVLQNAANSGVGQCVAQIARALGIPCVHFLRRKEDHEWLRGMGAEAVFADDAEGQEQARCYLRDKGLHAVLALNAVGGESALRLLDLLAPEGLHLTYGAMSRRPLTVPNKFLIFQNIHVQGFWLSSWMKGASAEEIRNVYRQLLALMAAGNLEQRIDSSYRLNEANAALARNATVGRRGKVMFVMD